MLKHFDLGVDMKTMKARFSTHTVVGEWTVEVVHALGNLNIANYTGDWVRPKYKKYKKYSNINII